MTPLTPSFPILDLHQVEITSRCNLRCVYCVHPKMARAKEDMTERVFLQALRWAATFVARGTQRELNLAGIGESTLHPEFVRFVFLAREIVGDGCELVLATNGILMTDDLADAIAPSRIRVYVSNHRPEKAGPATEAVKRAGIHAGNSNDPVEHGTNWAGQVNWHVSAEPRPCMWVRGGKVFAMSDGRVAQCSFDGTGEDPIGSVFDDLDTLRCRPYRLCPSCDQQLGIPGWDQRAGAGVPPAEAVIA